MALYVLAAASPLAAQPFADPQPFAMPPATAAPLDVAYPGGPLTLTVDATDTERRIVQVRETIPVTGAGPITLLYPQWLPGNHAPRGPLEKVAGLVIRAGGQVVPWMRDPVDVFAFHVNVPTGARSLEIEFQYLSPTAVDQGRVTMTPEMLNLQWNTLALYPAGYFARRVQVETSVRLPQGWTYATALEAQAPTGGPAAGLVRFKPVSLDVLVDSPLVAGRFARIVDLDPGAKVPVRLDIFADRPELLDANAEQLERHRELVRQSYRLFGARHYDHYDFLLSLSDRMGGIGLEHHSSSEDGTSPTYFLDWPALPATRDLLAHEYAHSWNGKFRRPADLWTPNFNLPMRGSLLWVYEGQTQYWGSYCPAGPAC